MPDSARRTRIVVFGDVIDDIVVVPREAIRPDTDTPSSITRRAGGSAANTAVWLGSLGASVDFVGIVGRDDLGRHGALFRQAGVTPHLTGHPSLATGTIVILVSGEVRSMLTERGANAVNDPASVTDDVLANAAVLLITGHSIYGAADIAPFVRLIARARAAGVAVAVSPGSAGFLLDFGVEAFLSAVSGTTILFPSLDEGRLLTGLHDADSIAAKLAESFDLVVMTLGADGAVVAGSASGRVPAIAAHVVDPTGAGDAFSAGFLASWVTDRDALRAAEDGVRVAARAIAIIGGRPA